MSNVNQTMGAEESWRSYKNRLISGGVTVGVDMGRAGTGIYNDLIATMEAWQPVSAVPDRNIGVISAGTRADQSAVKKQIEEAVAAERARILAALHDLRPYDEPYKRREWEWERKGAKEMHAKIIRAIEGEKK